ncbi:unnamed protein product [Larinioides sclopetarius]
MGPVLSLPRKLSMGGNVASNIKAIRLTLEFLPGTGNEISPTGIEEVSTIPTSCSGLSEVPYPQLSIKKEEVSTMSSSTSGLSEASYLQPSVKSNDVLRNLLPDCSKGTTGQPTSKISSIISKEERDRATTPRPPAGTRFHCPPLYTDSGERRQAKSPPSSSITFHRLSPYPLNSGGRGRRRQLRPSPNITLNRPSPYTSNSGGSGNRRQLRSSSSITFHHPSTFTLNSGSSGEKSKPTPGASVGTMSQCPPMYPGRGHKPILSFKSVQHSEQPSHTFHHTGQKIGPFSPPSPDRDQTTYSAPLPLSYKMWRRGQSSPISSDSD